LLWSSLKGVPLWLDEGLAEYFELPPEKKGLNSGHIDQLRHGGQPPPDLARLEKLDKVEQMRPPEYREAWAWIHLMLHSKPEAKTALLKYLQQLKTNATPGALEPSLAVVFSSPEEALEQHLADLDNKSPRPMPSAKR
jgi:hypothetical protein